MARSVPKENRPQWHGPSPMARSPSPWRPRWRVQPGTGTQLRRNTPAEGGSPCSYVVGTPIPAVLVSRLRRNTGNGSVGGCFYVVVYRRADLGRDPAHRSAPIPAHVVGCDPDTDEGRASRTKDERRGRGTSVTDEGERRGRGTSVTDEGERRGRETSVTSDTEPHELAARVNSTRAESRARASSFPDDCPFLQDGGLSRVARRAIA
jgi:hypothetical protein